MALVTHLGEEQLTVVIQCLREIYSAICTAHSSLRFEFVIDVLSFTYEG